MKSPMLLREEQGVLHEVTAGGGSKSPSKLISDQAPDDPQKAAHTPEACWNRELTFRWLSSRLSKENSQAPPTPRHLCSRFCKNVPDRCPPPIQRSQPFSWWTLHPSQNRPRSPSPTLLIDSQCTCFQHSSISLFSPHRHDVRKRGGRRPAGIAPSSPAAVVRLQAWDVALSWLAFGSINTSFQKSVWP